MSPFTPTHMHILNMYFVVICCIIVLSLTRILNVPLFDFLVTIYVCTMICYSYGKLPSQVLTKPLTTMYIDEEEEEEEDEDGPDDDDDGDSSSDYDPDEDDVFNYYYG